jgi:hypothetical protein
MKRAVQLSGIAVVAALALAGCAKNPPGAAPVSDKPTPTPTKSTPSPTAVSTLTLGGEGIGKYDFGSAEKKVADALAKRLGEPDAVEVGETCEGVSGQWGETLVYGDLRVLFTAKDLKTSSPRTLASWRFSVDKKLPKSLEIADDVPLDLSLAELKAKYPGSKSEDLGFGDGTVMLTLPNKVAFVGIKDPDFVMGGELPGCE